MGSVTHNYFSDGVWRFALGFPIIHPLEVVKLRSQGKPQNSSVQVIKILFEERGFKGFYNGALSNCAQGSLKEVFRWPAIACSTEFWNSKLPKVKNKDALITVATASTVAASETFIFLPFQRAFVSAVNEKGITAFLRKDFAQNGIKAFYAGTSTTYFKQLAVLNTFIGTNDFARNHRKTLDPDNKYPLQARLITSLLIAGNLTGLCLPIEFVRTQIQMRPELQGKSTFKVTSTLYKQFGIKRFYAGAFFCMLQTSFSHGILGSILLDKIDKDVKEKNL